jgi:alpha-methylacyl-CoA racemase
MAAVIGIQSALLARGPTSTGAFLDISLAEAASSYLTCGINPLSDRPHLIQSTPDRRLYKCGDGRYVAVASSEPRSWAALCDGVGLPELKGALRQVDQAASATEKLAATFLSGATQQWVESLAPRGVTITAVNHGRQLLEDPHVVARAAVVEVAGTPVPANPVRVSVDGESTGTALGAPPQVGADTTDILQAAGFSGDELRALEQQSII